MISPGIYPSVIPEEFAKEWNRQPEVQVYNALKESLANDFYIFYNCDWSDPRKDDSISCKDGEADFILAHPDLGFICLEVKGGEISRDQDTRDWLRKTNTGYKKIKNPVQQARNSKHVLLSFLQEEWKGRLPFIRMRHGVVLPNSGKPKGIERLGGDMPLDIFAFFEDMEHLGGRILEMFLAEEIGSKKEYGKLGQQGIEIIYRLFQKSFTLPVSLVSELDHYDKRISSLTEEQETFLELTAAQKKMLVVGGAGTGKTFLAHRKAMQTVEAGEKTLLLVFNTGVASYLKSMSHDVELLTVKSFHEFCGWACTKSGLSLQKNNQDNEDFYNFELPSKLIDALDKNSEIRFDSIVVDEAQDFRTNWWEAIFLSLKDFQNANIYIFADDNQNIYGSTGEVEKLLNCAPFYLTKNVRNTQSIFKVTNSFYNGKTNSCIAPDGPHIRWISVEEKNKNKALKKEISRLVNVDGVPVSSIAILSMCNREKSQYFSDWEPSSVSTELNTTSDQMVFDSVWRFKGLERKVVIVTDIEDFLNNTSLLYVAFSRARTLLFVVGNEKAIKMLKNASEM